MVNNHGILSIGVKVTPEIYSKSEWKDKEVNIGVDYKIRMADIIITVCDYDHQNEDPASKQHRLLKEEAGKVENGYGEQESAPIVKTFRPTCRRRRTEGNLSNLSNNSEIGTYSLDLNSVTPTIPRITPNMLKPCEYYRQKYYHNNDLNYWTNYSALQKSAGQKVVSKIAAQQKILEAEAAETKQKGKEFLNNNSNNERITSLPLKKRTTKLEPLPIKLNAPNI